MLLLTHAHLDHCGLIPRLVAEGFRGPIITVQPSVQLAQIILMDAASIQEEDAAFKKKRHRKENRRGRHPEIPLYTREDAQQALKQFKGVTYDEPVTLDHGVAVVFREAGHILGSAMLELSICEGDATTRLAFSGDLGQWDKPLIGDPQFIERADYVVLESTYGNRTHKEDGGVQEVLRDTIQETVRGGGNLLIPTFAVERAQELMFHISRLIHNDQIPRIPIYLDSPMAVDVTEVFQNCAAYLDEQSTRLFAEQQAPLRFPGLHLVRSAQESKQINKTRGPAIIMSTSGMCTAGRIKHHLAHNIDRAASTILFVGYQANGTLGRQILEKRRTVRIHGRHYPVKARIARLHGLSAHGDRDDLLRWLDHFSHPPKRLFLTHGEKQGALSLARAIEQRYDYKAAVPTYQEVVEL